MLHLEFQVQHFFMAKTTYQIDIDGYIGEYYYSARYVRNMLEQHKGKDVFVRMNSLGGSLDHGLNISDRFADHSNVTVDMFGFNASAATIATLGAKKVRISSTGFYLIHKVMNWIDIGGSKNADEIAEIIKDLEVNKKENEKIDLVIAQKYSEKTGKSINGLLALMKTGGWMTAKEALEWGFVDEIIKSSEKTNVKEMMGKLNAFGLPVNIIGKNNFINFQTSQAMKKQYSKVNAILAVERLESTDDGVFLNEAQIESIETKIDEHEAAITTEKANTATEKKRADDAEAKVTTLENAAAEKDTKITNLEMQVTNLKKGAGDKTDDAKKDVDEGGEKDDDFLNTAKSAKALYDALP